MTIFWSQAQFLDYCWFATSEMVMCCFEVSSAERSVASQYHSASPTHPGAFQSKGICLRSVLTLRKKKSFTVPVPFSSNDIFQWHLNTCCCGERKSNLKKSLTFHLLAACSTFPIACIHRETRFPANICAAVSIRQ